MYDIERVKKEFIEILDQTGTKYENEPISINSRLTRTLGRVCYKPHYRGERVIVDRVEFSKQLLDTSTDKSIRDVIEHEACHFIATKRSGTNHGHDAYFKSICAEIGCKNDKTSTKVERTVEERTLFKYTVYCNTCKKDVGHYSRLGRNLQHLESCYCSTCKEHNLKLIQNW